MPYTFYVKKIISVGYPMVFNNFVENQPDGKPYAHMDFDLKFAWNAKDDANDQDNGFICKKNCLKIVQNACV